MIKVTRNAHRFINHWRGRSQWFDENKQDLEFVGQSISPEGEIFFYKGVIEFPDGEVSTIRGYEFVPNSNNSHLEGSAFMSNLKADIPNGWDESWG